jgi:sec-independent protein translocase protein TatC
MDKSPFEALVEHLLELRKRMMYAMLALIVGFGVFYTFKQPLFQALTAPLKEAQGGELEMIFTAVPELFVTYLKMCFFASLFVTLPILLWQLWRFIAPGLYKNESEILWPFLVATPFMFYLGGAFSFFLVMPVAVPFFFGFAGEGLSALPSVKEYLGFFLKMTFAFGLAFELPVLLVLLNVFGIVDIKTLKWFRRYAVVMIFVASALLTPPDPASQLMLAVPLLILYEMSLVLCRFLGSKKEKPSSLNSSQTD